MTLIVGIRCADGVVIGSDSAATFGDSSISTIGQQHTQKIIALNDYILFGSTGGIGISQVLADRIRRLWNEKMLTRDKVSTEAALADRIGREIAEAVAPYFQSGQFLQKLGTSPQSCLCKIMLAIPVNDIPYLISFEPGGVPELATKQLPFVSMGSGQIIADPFLALLKRILWSESEPTVAEGRFAATWTISHVSQTNPGGVGGPIQLATLPRADGTQFPRVEIVGEADIQEHRNKIDEVEKALQSEIRGTGRSVQEVPIPPQT